jgi:hypothetical protein
MQHRHLCHSLPADTGTSYFVLLTDGSFHCIPPHCELNGEHMSNNVSTYFRKLFPPNIKRVKGSQNNFSDLRHISWYLLCTQSAVSKFFLDGSVHALHRQLCSSAQTSSSILLVHQNHLLHFCNVHTSFSCQSTFQLPAPCADTIRSHQMIPPIKTVITLQRFLHDKFCVITPNINISPR